MGVCTEGHRKNPPSHLMHIFYNSKYSNSVLAHADSAACFGVNEFALRKHCCKLPFFVLIVGYLRISNMFITNTRAHTHKHIPTNQPTDSINNFRIANIAKESVLILFRSWNISSATRSKTTIKFACVHAGK